MEYLIALVGVVTLFILLVMEWFGGPTDPPGVVS